MEPSLAESICLFGANVFSYVKGMPKSGHAVFSAADLTRPRANAKASRSLYAMVR